MSASAVASLEKCTICRSPVLVPRLLPFWTLLPLRPKDVNTSGILDEEPEHRDRNQQQEQENDGVSLAKF